MLGGKTMTDDAKRIIAAVLLPIIGYYIGAMFNFGIFMANDLSVRVIGFCTVIICVLIAVCTNQIIKAIKEGKEDHTEN